MALMPSAWWLRRPPGNSTTHPAKTVPHNPRPILGAQKGEKVGTEPAGLRNMAAGGVASSHAPGAQLRRVRPELRSLPQGPGGSWQTIPPLTERLCAFLCGCLRTLQ